VAGAVEPCHESVIEAFGEVAEVITAGAELDEILHLIAAKLCELTDIGRCSIHLRKDESELFLGRVGHADRDIDAEVRRMRAGTPADGLTREILATRRPVLLTNAAADARAIRSTMRYWNVRSLLGVPMVLGEEVIGLIFLDNMDEPHPYSPAHQQIAATFANLAATAVTQVKLTGKLRASLATVTHQNQLLKRAAAMEHRLTELLLRGSGVRKIAEAVTALTRRPCVVYDSGFNPLERVASETDQPCVLDARAFTVPVIAEALAALPGSPARVLPPVPGAGFAHRMLFVPVRARGKIWGYLALVERGGRLGPLDEMLARRAAANIALEVGASRRDAEVEWQARESLASALIRGEIDRASLDMRADLLGVHLRERRIVVLVGARTGEQTCPQAHVLADAIAGGSEGEEAAPDVLATGVAGGAAVILTLPLSARGRAGVEWARRRVREALARAAPEGALLAALSARCEDAEDLPRGYAEAEQILRCLTEHVTGPGHQVLAADDLGAGGRVFLASTSGPQAWRFVEGTLGEVIDTARHPDLLDTVAALFDCSHGIRRAATRLGVHENTIRYRMSRVTEITGLRLCDDINAQLSVQLCLLILRLSGRLAPLGARVAEPAPSR
jgi:sugar diacid utilization regulator